MSALTMSNLYFDLHLPRDSMGPVYQKAYLDQVVETRVINLGDNDKEKSKGLPHVTVVLDRDGVEDTGEEKDNTSNSCPPEPPVNPSVPAVDINVDTLPASNKNFIEVVLDPPSKKKSVEKKYSYNDIRALCKKNGIPASGTKKSLIKQLQQKGVKLE